MKLKRYTPLPPEDFTADLEEMFGPGYRIRWEEWLCGPGSTRSTWRLCQEFYRFDEWARTGVEPPPIGRFHRLVWRIQKRICRDYQPWLEEPPIPSKEDHGLAR